MTDFIKQEAKEFLSFDDIDKEYKKYKKLNCDNYDYVSEEWGEFIDRRIQDEGGLLEKSINYRFKPPLISYKYNITFTKEKPASPEAVHRDNCPTGPPTGSTDYTLFNRLVNNARLNYYRYYEEKYNFIISEIPKIDENRLKEKKINEENKLKQSKIDEENRLKKRDILIHK